MNLMKFSRPCSHFGIIFEQEEGKRGIPLYQTWHIVNSITLYHLTSHSISELHIYIIEDITRRCHKFCGGAKIWISSSSGEHNTLRTSAASE